MHNQTMKMIFTPRLKNKGRLWRCPTDGAQKGLPSFFGPLSAHADPANVIEKGKKAQVLFGLFFS